MSPRQRIVPLVLGILLAGFAVPSEASALPGSAVAPVSNPSRAQTVAPNVWRARRAYCKDYKCVDLVVNVADVGVNIGKCEALAVSIYGQYHPVHGSALRISIDGLSLRRDGITMRDTGYLHWDWWSAGGFSTDWFSGEPSSYTAHIRGFRVRYADGWLSSSNGAVANFVSDVYMGGCRLFN